MIKTNELISEAISLPVEIRTLLVNKLFESLRVREKISWHSSRSDLWLDLVGLIEQNRRNNWLF